MNPDAARTRRAPVLITVLLLAGCLSPDGRGTPSVDSLAARASIAPEGIAMIESREIVVLLHGLGRTRRSLSTLHRHLEREGFEVIDWSYPSVRFGIQRQVKGLSAALQRLDARPDVARIHLVGHSLGGIVARLTLAEQAPEKLGRLVMLAPPNQGSDRARAFAWLGGFVPALPQLSSAADSEVRKIPVLPGLEIGIIAGSRDGIVPVANTHLDGETDHIVVKSGHTFIMNKLATLDQVVHFLRRGRFRRRPARRTPEKAR